MKLDIELAPLTIICGDHLTCLDVDYDEKLYEFLFLPETHLSTKEQVKLARRISGWVYYGSHIILITYSDYIIKEFNMLIMLNNNKEIQLREGYKDDELLDVSKIKAYDIVNDVVSECNISTELGIEIPSLDNVISEMNRIQDALVWS